MLCCPSCRLVDGKVFLSLWSLAFPQISSCHMNPGRCCFQRYLALGLVQFGGIVFPKVLRFCMEAFSFCHGPL